MEGGMEGGRESERVSERETHRHREKRDRGNKERKRREWEMGGKYR